MSQAFVEVQGLRKFFDLGNKRVLKAVNDISFSIRKGETLGLVGESGCGKSTASRTIIRLYEPTAGQVLLDGTDVTKLSKAKMKAYRRKMQMIFQDPYASLNPRMTILDIVGEALDIHGLAGSLTERKRKVEELLEMVGLNAEHASRYPHEFSGGQRQRIGITRALAVKPEFLILDEPISALDVSIQAQIINLMIDLQKKMNLTYLFVAHDLSMVKYMSDRVAVMYLGKIVEMAPSEELYANPQHPYTQALLSAIPVPDPDLEAKKERIVLSGDLPSPLNPPSGCPFRTRCPAAMPQCAEKMPEFKETKPGHGVACHLHN
ncbi:ABC transporter ATP-binding protein [Cohnella caldifontis]|uniref:ABC transporter ATP-binding protein n=1 Tax=Cohnella caldifontis TaxID=3027471 RepID=UPI0023EC077D|nr:ABC transporter ATP-binding protein [Cohnella sp. YIM B05605]